MICIKLLLHTRVPLARILGPGGTTDTLLEQESLKGEPERKAGSACCPSHAHRVDTDVGDAMPTS